MTIDRCACFGQTFRAQKEEAARRDARTLEALQEHVTFGENCRLCHPYVRRMLRTGEIEFHEIIRDE